MPESATPADDRCLAGLCAALEASRGEPGERVLGGFAEALVVEFAALLQLRDGVAAVRVLGARDRRPSLELELRLPAAWLTSLAEGRLVANGAGALEPGDRSALRLTAAASVLIAAVPAAEGPPQAAVLLAGNLSDGTWSSGQEQALRGLAAGLAGWLTARAWQQVLDALPQRIAWKDGGLRYRGANRAFARASGLSSAQLLGRVDAELPLRADSGDHGELAQRRERAALGAAQLRHLESAPQSGGRELWFEVSRVPLDGGLLVVRDEVSARVQLAQQLQRAQRMAAIGRLAAGVGADLRPITAELSAAVAAARVDLAAGLDRVDRSVRAADDLARQLVLFERRQLQEPVDLLPGPLLARMQPTLERLLGEHVRLQVIPSGLRCAARLDPRLFEQLLALLVVHLRERLGGRGRVDIELTPDTLDEAHALELAVPVGEYVRLRLRGAPELGVRPSEPGLRLSLARAIVGQFGGGLQLAEDPLRIDIHLPRVFTTPRPAPGAGPVVDLRGAETLLLVEQDPILARTLATVLRHLGYCVHTADDLAAAHEQVQKTCPAGQVQAGKISLALLSAGLPAPASALRQLRAALPELRVLWLSGSAGPQGLGGDPLIVPCSFEALALRVRQALDARLS